MFATNAQVAEALEVATAAAFDTRPDKERVVAGLKAWKKERKALARLGFTCCGTCGHYEMSEKAKGRPYAFTTKQDWLTDGDEYLRPFRSWIVAAEGPNVWGWRDPGLTLRHSGTSEDINALVRCLQAEGLEVEWDGTEHTTVSVKSAYRWEGEDERARKIAGLK